MGDYDSDPALIEGDFTPGGKGVDGMWTDMACTWPVFRGVTDQSIYDRSQELSDLWQELCEVELRGDALENYYR